MFWLLIGLILVCLVLAVVMLLVYRRAIYRPRDYIDSPHQDRVRELERRLADHIALREKNARERERLEEVHATLLVEYTRRKEASGGSITDIQELLRDRAVLDRLGAELGIEEDSH